MLKTKKKKMKKKVNLKYLLISLCGGCIFILFYKGVSAKGHKTPQWTFDIGLTIP